MMKLLPGECAYSALAREFWSRVEVADPDQCWPWRLSGTNGYGRWELPVFLGWGHRASEMAHRVAWYVTRGPIPPGWTIDHRCRVPSCCNPNHLRLRTLSANCADTAQARRTHCLFGHPYAGDNLVIADGGRRCRTCQRRAWRESKQRTRSRR